VKIIFLCFICSVIPAFFAFIFLLGTRNRLTALYERCRTSPDRERAVLDYDAARNSFPASLVASWLGFGPVELSRESSVQKEPSNVSRSS